MHNPLQMMSLPAQATLIATTHSQHLPPSFFARPAEQVAPELIGCLLVKRQLKGELLWGVIVETEAHLQEELACHGYLRRTPSNETLFGEPGRFYVYASYGIHHCVNVVHPWSFFDSSAALMLGWLTSLSSILPGPSFLVTRISFASMAVWSVLLLMLCFQHLKMPR